MLKVCAKYVEEVDKELQSRDEHICNLKQEIFLLNEERKSTEFKLKERITSLTAENEQLLSLVKGKLCKFLCIII